MTRHALETYLRGRMHRPVSLRLTRNRVSMASIEFAADGAIRLSLDDDFRRAPADVLEAVHRYIRTRRPDDWQHIARHARQIPARDRTTARPARLRARGEVYDLAEIRDDVNHAFFGGKLKCRIGWGRGGTPRRRSRRSIRFGSWHESTRTVRIHPMLDNASVPREFVRYIVFHEMLHAVVHAEQRNGRSYPHAAQFRAMERRFPDFPAMKKLGTDLLHTRA